MFAIVIDLRPLMDFFNLPTDVMINKILFLFGWIPIAIVFLWGAKEVWLSYIRGKWGAEQKYILLAIDVPRGNTQSPKAVENIITYLAGAHGNINPIEYWWEGKFQVYFSLEIVSIDGYTQFIVYTPEPFRDLVESAIYSQYPDSEITEIDDYAKGYPTRYPDDEYDVWGAEFIQVKKPVYPIKVYNDFVYQLGDPEEHFKDPMATLMDLCSSLKKGEQLWHQIILVPEAPDCVLKKGEDEIKKILGEKVTSKKNAADYLVDGIMGMITAASEMVFTLWSDVDSSSKEEKDEPLKMMNLKPKEKRQIEAIQDKMSKIHFGFKTRAVYIAKKDVMQKPKAANGFVGYMKQFTDMDLNNLKPDMARTGTSAWGFFKDSRINRKKGSIVRNYKNRDDTAGSPYSYMSIEEIATLWHFPVEAVVKAPMIQKVEGRKAQPPTALPFDTEDTQNESFDTAVHRSEMDAIFSVQDKKKSIVQGTDTQENKKTNDEIIPDSIFLEEDSEQDKPEPHESIFEKDKPQYSKGGPPSNLPFA